MWHCRVDDDLIEERLELYGKSAKGALGQAYAVASMRRALGLSQAKFARMIKINPHVFSDFEDGVVNPTFETLTKIAAPSARW